MKEFSNWELDSGCRKLTKVFGRAKYAVQDRGTCNAPSLGFAELQDSAIPFLT